MTVRNNIVHDVYSTAYYVDATQSSTLTGNRSFSNHDSAFYGGSTPVPCNGLMFANENPVGSPVDGITATGNNCTEAGKGFYFWVHKAGGMRNTKINNNTFGPCYTNLIRVDSDSGHSNSEIMGNTFDKSRSTSIVIPSNVRTDANGGGAGAPVISSSGTASGTVGTAFSYQITASNSPTSYSVIAGNLSTGLTLNTSTGKITGTPQYAGSPLVTLGATNSAGTGQKDVQFTIASGSGGGGSSKPVISSSGTASGTVGQSFSYQITASGTPTSYSVIAGKLSTGLTLNTTTGRITGTPQYAGKPLVTLGATNSAGTGQRDVQFTISN